MFKTKTKYKDLITGKEMSMEFEGQPLSPTERWFKEGNYRKTGKDSEENCEKCRYHHLSKNGKHNHLASKCGKVGITDSRATDVKPDNVCDYWKEKTH